ncbi:MAG: putative glycosyl transferase family 2 protein [Clostridia bacterium]|jgi:glycosyltransferase involved in cell wall biosynthesis|nr:putative glycosyl transferase family 2 protein [Clostridia bacterium]
MGITAIIPAYNEEMTLGGILDCVKKVEEITQIIVVSDGSTDKTAEVARVFDIEVIELVENVGKGGAMKAGVERCVNDNVLFLDADLIGLTPKHVRELILPVMNNETEMTIGIFKNGRVVTDLAQKVTPYLSGQRALKKYILDRIPNIDITRYGVEVALTKYAEKNLIRTKEVILEDMTHVTKEEKMGLIKGMQARFKMYWEILKILGADDESEEQIK